MASKQQATFPKWRKEMRSVHWGPLCNAYKDASLDPTQLETEIKTLMIDGDVTKKSGIYLYVRQNETE